jgi:hypothetical protein
MIYAGANSTTAAEMKKVMHLKGDKNGNHEGYHELIKSLQVCK